MLPLLLTWLCLLLDLFLSVCTSVSGRVSLVCRLSLSNTRRRGGGSLHGTSFPSDWNQIDQPYQFTLWEEMPGLRGDHTRSLVSVNLQEQPTEGSNFSENLLIWAWLCCRPCGVAFLHRNMHTCTCSSFVNHISFCTLVSNATSPLFFAGVYVRVTGLDC